MPKCSQWLCYLLKRLIRCNAAGAFTRKEPVRWNFTGRMFIKVVSWDQHLERGEKGSRKWAERQLDLQCREL